MKKGLLFVSLALFAFLPLTAVAQRGRGSVNVNNFHAGNNARPASVPKTHAPSPKSTVGPTINTLHGGTTSSNAKSTSTASATVANTNQVAVTVNVTNQNSGDGRGHGIWWGGGSYFGVFYGPGWYAVPIYCPGCWYWNGSMGYEYDYAPYESRSGIKFDLKQISKEDRKAVSEAGVYLPDKEGKAGYCGTVGSFSGAFHKALLLDQGTYDITVALADGRTIEMNVTVRAQRVTNVALSLSQPPQADQQAKSN